MTVTYREYRTFVFNSSRCFVFVQKDDESYLEVVFTVCLSDSA